MRYTKIAKKMAARLIPAGENAFADHLIYHMLLLLTLQR